MTAPWIDLVNSDLGRSDRHDRLEEAAWLRAYLARWKLPRLDAGGDAARPALRTLRDLLRRAAGRLVERGAPSTRDLAALNRYLAEPVRTRLHRGREGYRLERTPAREGLDAVLFAIAASFAEFLAEGDPRRLRACENPECAWIFVDQTRSRTRRWCDEACGNVIKVRRFRARQKSL